MAMEFPRAFGGLTSFLAIIRLTINRAEHHAFE